MCVGERVCVHAAQGCPLKREDGVISYGTVLQTVSYMIWVPKTELRS